MTCVNDARAVVGFWRAAGPRRWFSKDVRFDALVRRRLKRCHELAVRGGLDAWATRPETALALVILLDQAPCNMFRGTPRAFATDARAVLVAEAAVARSFHRRVPFGMRQFFFLPFMHSERLADQQRGVDLYRQAADASGTHWAEVHRDIVRDFGRFPHRNVILRRATSEPERAFLDAGGFTG